MDEIRKAARLSYAYHPFSFAAQASPTRFTDTG
jgi:hypothetical protein